MNLKYQCLNDSIGPGDPSRRRSTNYGKAALRLALWSLAACLATSLLANGPQVSEPEPGASQPSKPQPNELQPSELQPSELQPGELQQEFRLVWGSPKPVMFDGTISVTDGSLKIVRNLSMHREATGCILQQSNRSIQVLPSVPSSFSGIDLMVRGQEKSRIKLRFRTSDIEQPVEFEVELREIQDGSWIRTLDASGSRVAIERQAHDRLRVSQDSTSMILDCGSRWELQVSGYRTGLAAGEYQLAANWTDNRSGSAAASAVVQVDSDGSFSPMALNIDIPEEEAAYRLDLTLTRPGLLSSWTGGKPLLSRSVELVAFDPQSPPGRIGGWSPVLAMDPVTGIRSTNIGRLASIPAIPWAGRSLELPDLAILPELSLNEQWNRLMVLSRSAPSYGSIESYGQIRPRDFLSTNSEGLEQLQQCVEISEDSWMSLPISGLQPGNPYRLRIEVPTDQSGLLNVTIREPKESERSGLYPQSNLWVREIDLTSGAGAVTHQVLFWPPKDSVNLVLASGHPKRSVSVGKILLERGELTAAELPSSKAGTNEALRARLAGFYVDQPLLVDSLAAPRQPDPLNGRAFETWSTWQAVAQRLVQHLRLSGANTLVLTSMADGGGLIPIKSLPTIPWLDKSTFYSDGRSPSGHDPIGLLLHHFDRADLRLVIELDLDVHQFQGLQTERRLSVEPGRHPADFSQVKFDAAFNSQPSEPDQSRSPIRVRSPRFNRSIRSIPSIRCIRKFKSGSLT
jgi:hypothetical protein